MIGKARPRSLRLAKYTFCVALLTTLMTRTILASNEKQQENTLLVWAGDQARIAPDFIAVVDFDPKSPTYGRVLRTVPLSGASAVGNEPHHVGLSRDGRTLALGGLLSILKGQDEVFFYDVTSPRYPTFIGSDNPPDASITDDFAALNNDGFLVTFMGGANGGQPGRVVEYDANLKRTASWPAAPPVDGFNPHGISIDEAKNLMVTSDFICPLLTLNIPGGDMAHMRGTVRVWDLANRTIIRSIDVNPGHPAGTMDVALIPHDVRQRAFTAGMMDNKLYLVDTQAGTSRSVYDFNTPRFQVAGIPTVMPQLMRINKAGTRLFVTLNYGGLAGKVVMFNIARRDRPKVMDVVDLGRGSGPHFLRLTRDEKRLVVTDYFLVEDLAPGGIVTDEGDHKIHVINVHGDRLELDRRFDLDFNRDIGTGRARPHGAVMLPAEE
jgi:hypothetical protein